MWLLSAISIQSVAIFSSWKNWGKTIGIYLSTFWFKYCKTSFPLHTCAEKVFLSPNIQCRTKKNLIKRRRCNCHTYDYFAHVFIICIIDYFCNLMLCSNICLYNCSGNSISFSLLSLGLACFAEYSLVWSSSSLFNIFLIKMSQFVQLYSFNNYQQT